MNITRTHASTPFAPYRALQVIGLAFPLLATILTIYGLSAHRAREANLVFASLFAQGWVGVAIAALIHLALTLSVIGQTEYLWRHGQRDRRRIPGWAILSPWSALTGADALHDLWVALLR